MKLLFSVLGFLLLAAWLIEMWAAQRSRQRRERDRQQEQDNLRHITGTRAWWKEPRPRPDDENLGDH
jgi:hypothetical protein